MDRLTIATVPLVVFPHVGGAEFVISIDEQAGVVRVDPVGSQEHRMQYFCARTRGGR